jgi:hypothetical protein
VAEALQGRSTAESIAALEGADVLCAEVQGYAAAASTRRCGTWLFRRAAPASPYEPLEGHIRPGGPTKTLPPPLSPAATRLEILASRALAGKIAALDAGRRGRERT